MRAPTTLAGAPWLEWPAARAVFGALEGDAGRTRAVGGIVRDTLLGLKRADIDMATEFTPDEVLARARSAGLAAHPTGIEHGTVTLVHAKVPIEVTTLRRDIATDGRHAVVRFGTDWAADAARRDFTMNAVYAYADGTLYDPLGGIADCLARKVTFIGRAEDRIREDYLRVLRFFRFFAVYGDGRPDADGLKACARLKSGLGQLSAERVWGELKKLLGAADPSRSLLWMRTASVLSEVLPESEKWGIDAVHGLIAAEARQRWKPDALLRLMTMMAPRPEVASGLAERLKLSNAERGRLEAWAASTVPAPEADQGELDRQCYRGDRGGIEDRLRLAVALAQAADDAAHARAHLRQLKAVRAWKRPSFPLRGKDLVARGVAAGPAVGRQLGELEQRWIDSGFALDRRQLLAMISAD